MKTAPMNTQHSELQQHLREQFGGKPFSRESAENVAFRCGEVSEAINELIQDGYLKIQTADDRLALAETARAS